MTDKYIPPSENGSFVSRSESHVPRETEKIIAAGKVIAESMDFEETESVMWRKVTYHFDLFEFCLIF
jgi:hypothetical protein